MLDFNEFECTDMSNIWDLTNELKLLSAFVNNIVGLVIIAGVLILKVSQWCVIER